tara:strand:- start:32261 stop:33580 length:1320 start_codon:yes stop_codon:yes gene_type:complete
VKKTILSLNGTLLVISRLLLLTCLLSSVAQGQQSQGYRNQRLLEYRNQVPIIDYEQARSDAVADLFTAIDAGQVSLNYEGSDGYLSGLLDYFGISTSSQVLVFSKTALKGRLISPQTPRAIYFNDEVYVAFVPGTPSIEIASMDPMLGPVFYEIPLEPDEAISLRLHTSRCLSCHVKNYMSDGGVPLFMLQTTLVDKSGDAFAFIGRGPATTSATPFEQRWGGWYVTGLSEQAHLGNLSFDSQPSVDELDLSANSNLNSLGELVDISGYLSPHSDIVALLVMQHQVDVQNEIARVNYRVRTIASRESEISADTLAEETEPLVKAIFMSDEFALTGPVTGLSGYAEHFQSLGPFASDGSSLRELDLQKRVFKYPLSFQIYTEAFDTLPEQALAYLRQRITDVLSGRDQSAAFAHISAADRQQMLRIVQETKASLLDQTIL